MVTDASADALLTDVRFWKKVQREDRCWLWGAYCNEDGYGCLNRDGISLKAHRYAWELATGEVLTAHDTICHTCDVPNCVRNDEVGTYRVGGRIYPRRGHLYKATQPANVADRDAKGRGNWAHGANNGAHTHPEARRRGALNGNAILTDSDVLDICWRYASGGNATEIARDYGLADRTVVFAILKGVSWKHVVRPTYDEIRQIRGETVEAPPNSKPCADCGTIERKRIAKGLCERCYGLRDRRAKGKGPRRGQTHSRAKLSDTDVLAIRAAQGKVTGRALAAQYGISPGLVTLIQQRKIWTHI